jgi:hypothetical protein
MQRVFKICVGITVIHIWLLSLEKKNANKVLIKSSHPIQGNMMKMFVTFAC